MIELSLSDQRVVEHLDWLLRASRLRGAESQASALRCMFEASQQGRVLSNAQLSRLLGNGPEREGLDATRETVRRLRLTLSSVYAEAPADQRVRLVLSNPGYSVGACEVGDPVQAAATARPEPTGASAVETRVEPRVPARLSALARAARLPAALGVILVLLFLARGFQIGPDAATTGPPHRIEQSGSRIAVVDFGGRSLPAWDELVNGLSNIQAGIPESGFEGTIRLVPLRPELWPDAGAVLATCAYYTRCSCSLLYVHGPEARVVKRLALPILQSGTPCPPLQQVGSASFEQEFFITSAALTEFDGDGLRDEVLISVSGTRQFPAQILVFDPTGPHDVLLDYWNMGRAWSMPLGDLDADGRDEQLLYGTDNAEQAAFATIVKSRDVATGSGYRSPDGRRQILLEEVASNVPLGISLSIPASDLAALQREDGAMLRSEIADAQWAADRHELTLTVSDAYRNPDTMRLLEFEVHVDLDDGALWVTFLGSHDLYLRELMKAIKSGRLRDDGHVMTTERVEEYASHLSGRIRLWTSHDAVPAWRPYDPERFVASVIAK